MSYFVTSQGARAEKLLAYAALTTRSPLVSQPVKRRHCRADFAASERVVYNMIAVILCRA